MLCKGIPQDLQREKDQPRAVITDFYQVLNWSTNVGFIAQDVCIHLNWWLTMYFMDFGDTINTHLKL